MASDEFDLHGLVREQLASSAVADPYVLAEHITKLVPDEDLRDALLACLPAMVRELIRNHRLGVRGHAAEPGPSRKAGALAWHAELLRQREYTTDGWKLFGELTAAELVEAARLRREQAERNLAIAETYDRLAARMRKLKAATVAEVPAEVLEAVYR